MERKEFNERIQKEYDEFKTYMLTLPKEEIFNAGFKIDLKSYLASYLQSDDSPIKQSTIDNLASIDGNILDYLLDIYLNSDTYYTYDDLCEEILEIFDGGFYDDGDEIE